MAFNTEAQWRNLFETTRAHNVQIKKRVDTLAANAGAGLVLVAPVGLDEGDPEVSTRALSPSEKTALRQAIVAHVNAVIADYQASIAP